MMLENTLPMAGPSNAKTTMTQIGTTMQTAKRTKSTTTTIGNLLLVGVADGGLSMIPSFLPDGFVLVLRGKRLDLAILTWVSALSPLPAQANGANRRNLARPLKCQAEENRSACKIIAPPRLLSTGQAAYAVASSSAIRFSTACRTLSSPCRKSTGSYVARPVLHNLSATAPCARFYHAIA